MKKLLIISYFYPPSNFVGGERTEAWFRYLQEEGFYPIVVTRCWNEGQRDVIGEVEHNEYSLERIGNGEIHRVPVPRDLRNRIGGPIRKLLTLRRLLGRNTDAPNNEFKTLYDKCVNILKEDPEIKTVIASGRPFESFQIGYLLKKEFDITWIPDYRDEWNTHLAPINDAWIWRKIHKQEEMFEKKWTSNADHFLTVSNTWKERINSFIDIQGEVIMNGYNKLIDFQKGSSRTSDSLHLLYAGTLYPSQKIELLINAVQHIQSEGLKIHLTFVGIEMIPDQKDRIIKLTEHLKDVEIKERMKKEELLELQSKADILVMTAFENVDGWLPVKMFDYYATGKTILVCPPDNDVIEEFITSTNSGVCINDKDQLILQLKAWINMKKEGKPIVFERNLKEGGKYSRRYQTQKLATKLKN